LTRAGNQTLVGHHAVCGAQKCVGLASSLSTSKHTRYEILLVTADLESILNKDFMIRSVLTLFQCIWLWLPSGDGSKKNNQNLSCEKCIFLAGGI
jgi:hypothetical protein